MNWFNFCNESLFATKTLTLHKSQVHGPGVMQLSLQFNYAPVRGRTLGRILLLLVFIV